MEKEKLLAQSLEKYVREKHTQEECVGFIDGFKEAFNIKSNCKHDRVDVEDDGLGNTHYCSKCRIWNF